MLDFLKGNSKLTVGIYSFVGGGAATLIILAAVIGYGFLAYPLPWKVTDPASARFDYADFKFTDYHKSGELGYALSCLFPKGTPKKEIDKILVDIGNAKVKKYESKNTEFYHPNEFRYDYPNRRKKFYHFVYSMISRNTHIFIKYDDQNLLEDAHFLIAKCRKGK